MEIDVYVDTHHIRWRQLYVMPLVSTFMDEKKMDGCIRKAVEWCEAYPHMMPLTLRKSLYLKPSVLPVRTTCGVVVVAEVVCVINSACVFIGTLYPC